MIPFPQIAPILAAAAAGGGGVPSPLSVLAYWQLTRAPVDAVDDNEDVPWNIIRIQSGFTPALSGTVPTVTAPAGTQYGILTFRNRSFDVDSGSYFDMNFAVNGTPLGGEHLNAWHNSRYSTGLLSSIVVASPGQAWSCRLSGNNRDVTSNSGFGGYFIG